MLQELQTEIIENRKRRGWESAHNIDKTVLGLVEEYGELVIARETSGVDEVVDAYVDIAVFALGGLLICGTRIVECAPVGTGQDRTFTIGMFAFVKGDQAERSGEAGSRPPGCSLVLLAVTSRTWPGAARGDRGRRRAQQDPYAQRASLAARRRWGSLLRREIIFERCRVVDDLACQVPFRLAAARAAAAEHVAVLAAVARGAFPLNRVAAAGGDRDAKNDRAEHHPTALWP